MSSDNEEDSPQLAARRARYSLAGMVGGAKAACANDGPSKVVDAAATGSDLRAGNAELREKLALIGRRILVASAYLATHPRHTRTELDALIGRCCPQGRLPESRIIMAAEAMAAAWEADSDAVADLMDRAVAEWRTLHPNTEGSRAP